MKNYLVIGNPIEHSLSPIIHNYWFTKHEITANYVKKKVTISDLENVIKKVNKLMSNHGRLLIRKSGTEPKIRIMGESYNKKLILKCIKLIKKSIK